MDFDGPLKPVMVVTTHVDRVNTSYANNKYRKCKLSNSQASNTSKVLQTPKCPPFANHGSDVGFGVKIDYQEYIVDCFEKTIYHAN